MEESLGSFATWQARLDTFTAPKTKSRRPSSTRGKRSVPKLAVKGGWPLDSPHPNDLAYAGFIFKPTTASPDNVMCFHCQTQLDGWEPNDTPAHEHLTHSPNCGFAINVCIRMRGSDPGRTEDDPLSERMMEARRETFQDLWPLDAAAGYPSIGQMAEGGWYYDPSDEYPDGATCPYCSLSLDSWDIGDDPTEQHLKRADDCLFFTLKEYYHPTQPQKKATRGKRASTRSSTASTKAKKTTRTKKGVAKDLDKPLPPPPDETMTDSIMASFPEPTNASFISVAAPAPPAKRGRRAKKASTVDETMTSVPDSIAGGLGLSMISIPPKAPPAKRGRKPKNSSTLEEAPVQSSFAEPTSLSTAPATAKAPAKKGSKAKNATSQPQVPAESFGESFAVSVASSMSKPAAKGRQTRKAPKRASTVSAASNTRSTRAAKRKSDEMDVDNDADVEMEMEVEAEEQRPSPKLTRMSTRLSDISLPQFESTPLHTPKEYRKDAVKSPVSTFKNPTPKAATPRTAVRPGNILRSPFQSFVNSPLGARSPIRARPRTPEGPQTPEAAPSSASKWDPIIISNIIADAGLDKENSMDIDMADTTENNSKAVLASLTSPEKRMTIEQFVLHNAKRGEEKLRQECERQIAAFEAEGRRALAALDAY
ncbi:inhibitor of apoptosis repeat-containing protein [Bimuria novae-zelandiae CBS 107.79]|uniref:Inhibitor of apoptosis repeat-containing protein n=1 Tax=Bimuria novae-zelandiae CBS 107.79 TaxID=1447943 RepID=A0A6A5VWQ4_9PLEO|nr:inhibitor of apoptosis repeat-containing protein [Bimuria novae-zelandiae CBS 107.79]